MTDTPEIPFNEKNVVIRLVTPPMDELERCYHDIALEYVVEKNQEHPTGIRIWGLFGTENTKKHWCSAGRDRWIVAELLRQLRESQERYKGLRSTYERFKHLESFLSVDNTAWAGDDPGKLVAQELWEAVKNTLVPQGECNSLHEDVTQSILYTPASKSVKDPKDGTPFDEAVRRFESGTFSPSVCAGLHAAAEAFGEDPNDVSDDIAFALSWMKDDMDARRDQDETGLDADPLSPEIQQVTQLLEDLRAGRVVCRRIKS